MKTGPTPRVVVVGAGPTGLALACGLRAAGVAVRLLDAADVPAMRSRAQNLQPGGSAALHRLDTLGDLPDRAVRTVAGIGFAGTSLVQQFLLADVHTNLDRSPNDRATWFAWLHPPASRRSWPAVRAGGVACCAITSPSRC